ncbi:arylesterase [Desulfogranum japonicum]|uniref:arylesterase n=1 Tax=Desulfogranum japonicum TaxID=231447 RepID=UPI0003F90E7B|nr:arylesterase [Desulfogranum japonicum]
MKPYILLCIMLCPLLLFTACDTSSEPAPKTQPATKKKYEGIIVALGDSLTAGLGVEQEENYPTLLQQKLTEQGYSFKVINAGVSGETSSGTLSRLNWILSQNPDIVILEIGANDGLRGIDPALVENNIADILQKLQEKEIEVVLAGMQMVWNLGEQYTTSFNAIYPRLADQFGVIFMPFFLESVAAEPKLNTADGIHPNAEGYSIITDNLVPYVTQAIERFRKKDDSE